LVEATSKKKVKHFLEYSFKECFDVYPMEFNLKQPGEIHITFIHFQLMKSATCNLF